MDARTLAPRLRLRWRSALRRRDVEARAGRRARVSPRRGDRPPRRARRVAAPRRAARRSPRSAASSAAKDECRDARGIALIESVVERPALRPRHAAAVSRPSPSSPILTLALGIGATTAVFALRRRRSCVARLPYPAAGAAGHRQRDLSGRRRSPRRGASCGRWTSPPTPRATSFTLTGDGPAMRVGGARVSAELFDVLGVDAGARPRLPRRRRWRRAGSASSS